MLQKEMILFVNDFFKVWQPHDCMILFDEIHEFTPERGMGMEYSEEIERAVRHWRNKNVGFIFTTQRPSFTSKKVLALTDFMILYRITWSTDKDRVKEILGDMVSKQESEKLLQTLQTESFLSGYTINFIP
jgi:DNA helicase HerA-like ATPase